MKALSISRLGFVGAMLLGTVVVWCAFMPDEVNAGNAVAIFGAEDDCLCAQTSICPDTYGGETCESGTWIQECSIDHDTLRTHNCEIDTSNKPCGSACGELTGGTYTRTCNNIQISYCPDCD